MLQYKFSKAGHVYTISAENRTVAREKIERAFHIDLAGASFQEISKKAVINAGLIK